LRVKFNEAFVDDRQIGAGNGLVEADEDIAGFDMIAVAHEKFADDAAGRMLHFLHISIDDNRALRDKRARDLGCRRPAPKSDHQHTDQNGPGENVPTDRFAGTGRRACLTESPRHGSRNRPGAAGNGADQAI
jgi:hypothetical protein